MNVNQGMERNQRWFVGLFLGIIIGCLDASVWQTVDAIRHIPFSFRAATISDFSIAVVIRVEAIPNSPCQKFWRRDPSHGSHLLVIIVWIICSVIVIQIIIMIVIRIIIFRIMVAIRIIIIDKISESS
jgi:hypothetical protein